MTLEVMSFQQFIFVLVIEKYCIISGVRLRELKKNSFFSLKRTDVVFYDLLMRCKFTLISFRCTFLWSHTSP